MRGVDADVELGTLSPSVELSKTERPLTARLNGSRVTRRSASASPPTELATRRGACLSCAELNICGHAAHLSQYVAPAHIDREGKGRELVLAGRGLGPAAKECAALLLPEPHWALLAKRPCKRQRLSASVPRINAKGIVRSGDRLADALDG